MTWNAPIYPDLRPGIVLAVAMVVAAGCATSDSPLRNTVESPIAPFGDLFSSPDTVRLDSEVVVGIASFLDVSQEGHLLIADEISKSAHPFLASGKHIQTYLIGTCQPDRADDRVKFARFIGGGKVMLLGGNGSVAVFDESGGCAATEFRHPIGLEGACAIGDSVFMQPGYTPYHKPEVHAVTRNLEKLDIWQIEEPDFPRLNGFYKGFRGRSRACFADGPYYKYAEWSDALPVFSRDSVAQVDPVFFTKRVQDIRLGPDVLAIRDEVNEYPTNSGILAIDSTTRMIVYSKLPIEWRLPDVLLQSGIAVVSNVGAFPARTAVVPFYPIGAANGYVYRQADNEILRDGDFGNPLILRYKFVPPPNANPQAHTHGPLVHHPICGRDGSVHGSQDILGYPTNGFSPQGWHYYHVPAAGPDNSIRESYRPANKEIHRRARVVNARLIHCRSTRRRGLFRRPSDDPAPMVEPATGV